MRWSVVAVLLPLLSSCSEWFFSGENWIDRSRPVVLVETTGGIEPGAATEFGVLTLGRTGTSGPCRVHYFLGPTPIVETGQLATTGSIFTRAEIDLKTQLVRALDRAPTADDALLAMWTLDGQTTESAWVELASGNGITGDVLRAPGTPLPTGATVLCRTRDGSWLFTGLIAARATVQDGPNAGDYYVFAGVDRVREMLAVPRTHPIDLQPHYRTDDISVLKPKTQAGK